MTRIVVGWRRRVSVSPPPPSRKGQFFHELPKKKTEWIAAEGEVNMAAFKPRALAHCAAKRLVTFFPKGMHPNI